MHWLNYLGIPKRKIGDAYRLAVARGRVEWHKKDPRLLSRRKRIGGTSGAKIRYSILKRDNFACVLCGSTAKEAPLEIDHIIALTNGGTNESTNLRTLCEVCNIGKRIHEKEL